MVKFFKDFSNFFGAKIDKMFAKNLLCRYNQGCGGLTIGTSGGSFLAGFEDGGLKYTGPYALQYSMHGGGRLPAVRGL